MTLLDDRQALAPGRQPDTGGVPPGRYSSPPVGGDPIPGSRLRRVLTSESSLVAILFYGVYQTIAWLFDWKYLAFQGDAVSRMANGFYVLHSRDPHLAAVGFVWAPLSSAADLPFLLFNGFWPALASHDVAGTTVSALAMAGAVYQLSAMLRDWGVAIAPRLVLTVIFAASPMILLFGGNGMSEALYLFALLAATRYLSRWLRDDDLTSLVYGASALGIAYLERSEPVASALLAAPLVFWVTYARSIGSRRGRFWSGLTDATILVVPILTSFIAWAFISYVITGQPFQQFTSKYGNAALLADAHLQKSSLSVAAVHEVHAIAYLAPALPIILLAALTLGVLRRNMQLLALASILGGGLAFTLFTYLMGSIFPWYRYYIVVIPIEVLLVGTMFSSPTRLRASAGETAKRGGNSPQKAGVFTGIVAVAVCLLLLGPSIPGSLKGMDNLTYAPDVVLYYGFIFHKHPNEQDHAAKAAYSAVERMSNYIDSMSLPNGSIVVDTGQDCIPAVVTNVDNPRVFVITNDRDYQRTLDDPLTFHAHYLLTPDHSATDSIAIEYPTLAKASWVRVAHVFPAYGLCSKFTLYKVISHPQGSY